MSKPHDVQIETETARLQRGVLDSRLRLRFRAWLGELSDEQLTALDENWANVIGDAALDRTGAWIIADKAVAELLRP